MNNKIHIKKETFNEIIKTLKNTNNKYCLTSKEDEITVYQIDNNKLLNKLIKSNDKEKQEEYPKLIVYANGTYQIKLSECMELKISCLEELQDFLLNKINSIESRMI